MEITSRCYANANQVVLAREYFDPVNACTELLYNLQSTSLIIPRTISDMEISELHKHSLISKILLKSGVLSPVSLNLNATWVW